MKLSQTHKRAAVGIATILLLTIALVMVGRNTSEPKPKAGASLESQGKSLDTKSQRESGSIGKRRERAEKLMVYTVAEGSRETLRLALDKAVLRDKDGLDRIVPITPPATPLTLADRLGEFSSPLGVFPLAYVDSDEMPGADNLRVVTSGLRVKMPREHAESFAAEHGLKISALPAYAPEWVIFEASAPLEALASIDGIRAEKEVTSADVLIGRRPVPMLLPNDTLINDQWYLKVSGRARNGTDINVEDAWNYADTAPTAGVRGRNINIGIIDSGIQTAHPDFAGNINTVIDRDFVGFDNDPNPPLGIDGSDENHATAVAGVAAARGNNNLGVSGVAPLAGIVGERLITGSFTTDQQNGDALAWRTEEIQIKNNSWGYGGSLYQTDPLLTSALRNSSLNGRGGKGTIFAFSAGNSGDEEDSANYSELTSSIYTIAVGATDSLSRRAFYSEPGANLVITAPSNGFNGSLGISTADRTGSDGYNAATGTGGNYANDFSGTSSSCPVVSGAIALLLEKNPNLGWRDVQAILIRSAKKFNPDEPGWKTNAAGLHFNNDYGAGLIDVTAAVNLAATWTNLGTQTSEVSSRLNLNLSIPNNSSAGRVVQFGLPTSNLVTEHVTIKVSIAHTARGDMEISLTSPSGTVSQLAAVRGDTNDDYDDYTFSTVQNWGENSSGNWTLKIADRRSGANTTGGTLRGAELTVFGVTAIPVNPSPNVLITAPATGSVFSPGVGYDVSVSAIDFDIAGIEDTVTQVELFANGVSVGVDTTAPYSFALNPANNSYTYVAMATDPEGLIGESLPIFVTVKNQTPVINTALVSATGQAFDDTPVEVTAVDAIDAETDALTIAYLWQFSTDEETYTDSAFTTSILPANPANSGKLWRCRITANDGNTTSDPILTPPINLLDRPQAGSVRPGDAYTYQSGLVLKGDTLVISRQAIIHEFSQGPAGGTAEWIEILALKAGSLSGWSLRDAAGNRVTLSSSGVWNSIPAGTLIVVYNGNTPKDPLVPADSTDAASGKMVISSNNATYFTAGSAWSSLDNLGDSLFLADGTGTDVHEISYGNSLAASPHIGAVLSGNAAYYSGETDAGADTSGDWLITSSTIGRTTALAAISPAAVNPGVEFANGRYEQNFDIDPGVNGTFFPLGWSAYQVDFANTLTTNFDEMIVFGGGTSVGAVYNFGNKIGIYGGNSGFDPGFIALGIDNTRGVTGLKISYDLTKMAELARSMQVSLQYTVGNPNNTGTVWTSVAGGTLSTGTTPTGTINKFTNIPLPAIFQDRESPIYLRWYYVTSPGTTSAGGRDAIALDNVIISSASNPNVLLNLTLNPKSVIETAGANASTATLALSEVLAAPLTVNLSSSDTTEATVPATVLIPAGTLSVTFPITAVDDNFSDGPQQVSIRASAISFVDATAILTVTDNEPSLVGVTPALANNPRNKTFITRLRNNMIVDPPLFRIAAGTALPAGLTLNPNTGLISGTVAPAVAPGAYPVTIELTNVFGEIASQMIVINVVPTGSFTFASWIVLFPGLSDSTSGGDAEFDLLPNLVEYKLNSLPGIFDQPSPIAFAQTDTEISLTYKEAKNRDDVTLAAEWSTILENGSWLTTGLTTVTLTEDANSRTRKATLAVVPGDPKRFLRLRASFVAAP